MKKIETCDMFVEVEKLLVKNNVNSIDASSILSMFKNILEANKVYFENWKKLESLEKLK